MRKIAFGILLCGLGFFAFSQSTFFTPAPVSVAFINQGTTVNITNNVTISSSNLVNSLYVTASAAPNTNAEIYMGTNGSDYPFRIRAAQGTHPGSPQSSELAIISPGDIHIVPGQGAAGGAIVFPATASVGGEARIQYDQYGNSAPLNFTVAAAGVYINDYYHVGFKAVTNATANAGVLWVMTPNSELGSGPNMVGAVNNMGWTTNATMAMTTILWATNAFNGPTNTLHMLGKPRQDFIITTTANITNFSGVTGTNIQNMVVGFKASGADRIVYLQPPVVKTGDGLRQWTVTNGASGYLSIEINPYLGITNAVFRNFW